MTHESFRNAIAEALDSEYAAMIPEHGEHIFSDKFERRMQKLIRRRRKPYYVLISTGMRRAACIVVMFLAVSFTTVMSVEALRKPFLEFLSSIFSDHTTIESVLDLDGEYPETIEEKYMITEGLEGYELENEENTLVYNTYYYRNKQTNGIIVFTQSIVNYYKLNINSENIIFDKFNIDDNNVIVCEGNDYNSIIWNNGYYIFEIHSNLSKNTLIGLAKYVEKVEYY